MQYVNESEVHSISWSMLSALLRRYRWVILLVFLASLLTGWGVLQVFVTDLYESKAMLLVKVGRETTEVPSTVVNGNLVSQGVRIQDINSEVQMLSSERLVVAAIDKIGPDKFKSVLLPPKSTWGYPKYYLKRAARFLKNEVYLEALYALNLKKRLSWRDEVITGVIGSLKVEPVKESDVLVLKLRLPSAELAAETASEILAGYLQARGGVRRNAAARDYFDEQTKMHRGELQNLSSERADVRQTWNVSSVEEQRTLLLKQLSDLEGQRLNVDGQIRKLEQEQADMKSRLADLPATLTKEETFTRNPALESINERITNLQMERAKLIGRYLPTSQFVTQVDAEIASLESALKKETPTVLSTRTSENNPVKKELEKGLEERQIELVGLQAVVARLDQPIREKRAKIAELNLAGDALERVERDLRVAEQSYLTYYKRSGEAQLSEEMDARNLANVSVISPPDVPIEPVYPRKLFLMGILLPVALILGLGIAALLETMNDRIRDESDLRQIPGVPYLGSVRGPLPSVPYLELPAPDEPLRLEAGS